MNKIENLRKLGIGPQRMILDRGLDYCNTVKAIENIRSELEELLMHAKRNRSRLRIYDVLNALIDMEQDLTGRTDHAKVLKIDVLPESYNETYRPK